MLDCKSLSETESAIRHKINKKSKGLPKCTLPSPVLYRTFTGIQKNLKLSPILEIQKYFTAFPY